MSDPNLDVFASDQRIQAFFWLAVVLSLLLPRLRYGRFLTYPFALLGTWAHELGHGLTAVLLGGSFHRLVLFPNLGGTAFSSGVGSIGRAGVAAGGLLGPAVVGGGLIVAGSRDGTARNVLLALAAAVALSLVAVVRNLFGWLALSVIGALLGSVAIYAPEEPQILLVQLIGIQLCLASWGTLDYMFTREFVRDGRVVASDTQQIAEALVLPYWFWGAVIAVTSAGIVAGSFYLAWIRPGT